MRQPNVAGQRSRFKPTTKPKFPIHHKWDNEETWANQNKMNGLHLHIFSTNINGTIASKINEIILPSSIFMQNQQQPNTQQKYPTKIPNKIYTFQHQQLLPFKRVIDRIATTQLLLPTNSYTSQQTGQPNGEVLHSFFSPDLALSFHHSQKGSRT